MKIAAFITSATVLVFALGTTLGVYLAVEKFDDLSTIAQAQSRLELERAISDIPRYLNPERGYAQVVLSSADPNAAAPVAELTGCAA
jgi:methyl-accepting chemotaxis protein